MWTLGHFASRIWPTMALQFFHRSGRRIDVGGPQPGSVVQQKLPAEDIQRQITVVPVVARERIIESFLEERLKAAVNRIVGRIQIQNDLSRRSPMRFQKQYRGINRSMAASSRPILPCTVLAQTEARSETAPAGSTCSCPPAPLRNNRALASGLSPSDRFPPQVPPAADPFAADRDHSDPHSPDTIQ